MRKQVCEVRPWARLGEASVLQGPLTGEDGRTPGVEGSCGDATRE